MTTNINNEDLTLVFSIVMLLIFTYYFYVESVLGLIWSGVWAIIFTMDYHNCKDK